MAIVPSTDYSGQIDTSDPTGYPHGKAKNVSASGAGDGTPLERNWVNDVWGWFAAFLDSAGITPSGASEKVGASDMLDAFNTRIGTTENLEVNFFDFYNLRPTGNNIDVTSQEVNPKSFCFSKGGLKLYVNGSTTIYEYNVGAPYRLDTASYASRSGSLTGDTANRGIWMNEAGTRLYTVGITDADIYEYTMSTPYEIDSIGSPTGTLATEAVAPYDIHVTADGTQLFVVTLAGLIHRYSMSAFTLSTGSYDSGQVVDVSSENTLAVGIQLSEDGLLMFVHGSTGEEEIYAYGMSPPYALSAAVYLGKSFVVEPLVSGTFAGFRFTPNGSYYFILGDSDDVLTQYISSSAHLAP